MSTRLSALDAAFLHVEDRSNRMQLAGVLTFDGVAPSYAEFRSALEERLPRLPHFRQRLSRGIGFLRPTWVEDTEFDLDYHLTRVALPAPGERSELLKLINDLTSAPLDLQRPLWEMALVEGLPGEQFGIALKVHHCMVDGLSIMQILATLFSADPGGELPLALPVPPPRRSAEVAADPPSDALALLRAGARQVPLTVGRLRSAAGLLGVAPDTEFNRGTSGPTRETDFVTLPLERVQRLRHSYDTTINNVILATVAGGLRSYFAANQQPIGRLFAFVPVNRRTDSSPGFHGNQIGMTYPALPVDEPDPAERVRKVTTETQACSATRQADDTAGLVSISGLMPEPVAALLNRALQLEAGMFNLTVTNVPGPPVPVYFLGRQLTQIVGSTPLTRRHALTVAALSYNGELTISVTADPRRVPGATAIVHYIAAEFDVLDVAAGLNTSPTKKTRTNR